MCLPLQRPCYHDNCGECHPDFSTRGPCSDREPRAAPYLPVSCVVEVVKAEAVVVPGESREKGEGRATLLSGKNESDVILSGAPETRRRASKDVKANNRGEKRRALLCMKEGAPTLPSGAPLGTAMSCSPVVSPPR